MLVHTLYNYGTKLSHSTSQEMKISMSMLRDSTVFVARNTKMNNQSVIVSYYPLLLLMLTLMHGIYLPLELSAPKTYDELVDLLSKY